MKKNNEEFVRDLMNFSPYGGLCQVFILEAIRVYAESVIQKGEPKFDNPSAFISPKAWYGIVKDVKTKIDER